MSQFGSVRAVVTALALGVVGVGGCQTGSASNASGPATCESVASAVKAYADKRTAMETDASRRQEYEQIAISTAARVAQHCAADKWTDAAISCVRETLDTRACKELTPEQLAKFSAPVEVNLPAQVGGPPSGHQK